MLSFKRTANEIVTHFLMTRIVDKSKTFVIVEGKTDRALWREYMMEKDCIFDYAEGKNTIIDALKSYMLHELQGIVGIVDLDYWLICQSDELGTENLLYDDCCPDMELILLSSPALKKVLRNTFHDYEVENIHRFAEKLKKEALRLAIEFGYFRLLNHNQDYGLGLNEIPFDQVIDNDTLEFDREWGAKRLAEDKREISSEELLQEVDELREKYPPDNIQLCRGKDVISIMAYILPTLFKSEFGEDLSPSTKMAFHEKELSKNLRMAYEFGYFKETSLFSCIRKWESNNVPFRIIQN